MREVTELGALDPARRVDGIAKESLARVREQARLQVAGRAASKPLYELLLDVEPKFGLDRLPVPHAGDLFLDLEGDPFVQGNGLEYCSVVGGPARDLGAKRQAPHATTPFGRKPTPKKSARSKP